MPSSRRRRALLALLLGALMAALGGELLLRELLFGDSTWARRHGERFRRAAKFADPAADDDFWKLQFLFRPAQRRVDLNTRHAELGWTSARFSARSWRHRDEAEIGARRPVLLFGDSFARCAVPPEDCWESLLERTPALSREYRLINYGVRGYGLDQTLLLLRAVLPRWRERAPVVIFSLLVDDDIDRCALRFRDGPKPRLELVGDALVARGPGDLGTRAWLRANPPSVRSYLWRYLTHRRPWLPKFLRAPDRDDPRGIAHKRALARAVFAEVDALLEEAGVEFFVLLFHGERTLALEPGEDWREALVLAACAELGMPFVSSRTAIREHSEATGTPLRDYYVQPEQSRQMAGHYGLRGQRAAFPALRRGLRGRYE